MTQSNLLELAQQGDPQAIAALMNQSLQPRGMTATVERAGDSLSVLLEADQVPNRQTLTAFVYRGISNLGVGSIRSVKVLGQQTGTNLPVWTQDLTLELPTTAADAIDAVDLSPTDLSPTVDSRADVSPTDDLADNLNGHFEADHYPAETNEMDLSLADLSSEFSAEDPSDELDALWVASSDEPSQESLADLLADEPNDLDSLFNEPPEESAAASTDNPLDDLRSMFGEQPEADFPSLEESSMNGASLNGAGTDNLQDLFGEDLEAGSPAEFLGTFDSPARLDGDLEADLSSDLGGGELSLESDDSDLAGFFGDDPTEEQDLGMVEETPVDQEDFQDLFGEDGAIATPTATDESDDPLMNFFGEDAVEADEAIAANETLDFSEPLPELSFSDEPDEPVSNDRDEDSLLDFLNDEPQADTSSLFDENLEETTDPLSFNDPVSLDDLTSDSEPLSFDEPLSFNEPASFDQPVSFDDLTLAGEPLSFDEPVAEPVMEPVEASMSLDDLGSFDEPLSFSEPEPLENIADVAARSTVTSVNFQEQQALADFFADDPLADFLAQPVQPAVEPVAAPMEEEFLEGGLSEPMAAATAQDYFSSDEPVADFQDEILDFQPEPDRDFLSDTFQPESEPTDLFSERMDGLESIDNWDGALENPLPDVEVNQADTISSLESLTDNSDLPELPTETWLNEPAFDRQPEAEPEHLHESQPRWDLDSEEEPMLDNLALPAIGAGAIGAGGIEDLTVSLPNLPQEEYQPVAYPSLNDPTQAAPQPKGSPWIFPLVLIGLSGWVLALIGFSLWLKDRDQPSAPPVVQPSAGSPVPSVPPAPANPPPAPSSAVPGEDDQAAIEVPEESASADTEEPDWMSVD
jgi:hypothetical protein